MVSALLFTMVLALSCSLGWLQACQGCCCSCMDVEVYGFRFALEIWSDCWVLMLSGRTRGLTKFVHTGSSLFYVILVHPLEGGYYQIFNQMTSLVILKKICSHCNTMLLLWVMSRYTVWSWSFSSQSLPLTKIYLLEMQSAACICWNPGIFTSYVKERMTYCWNLYI
jgi:hypothetical protein